MKNAKIYSSLYLILFALLFVGCDINSREALVETPVDSFKSTSTSLTVDDYGVEYNLEIEASSSYPADRYIEVEVSDTSTANGMEYSFTGTVVIKANETTGSTPIKFNFDPIPVNKPRTLNLKMVGSSEEITITYTKVCVSNDINLHIVFDGYPEETSWQITDSSSSVVASGGTYSGQTELNLDLTLPDGDYTFTISDVYGDGICCAWGSGSYLLSVPACSVVLAQGGSFAYAESTQFSLP
ncbi:hypothetical protein [Tenacibaculum sp. IB213877]|uniref:hypothetical protein n=1 Tax=Tenacibaculum sp. IB213877 TaxID=3097351 RepID=UPI002A59CE6E|nr:hypothetical protein [Tenacibaculum sp. IB213877]MDY0781184.1 hypothetical protein [Tenacibaculum sp. IB213877]